jgi:1,4-dihydroxy-2-naphthoyl-CoA hydrolase
MSFFLLNNQTYMDNKRKITIEQIRQHSIKNQLPEKFGLEIIEVGDDFMIGKLTVDERHLRPGNIMNGGVSLVLIETLGSFSSYLYINPETQNAFGIQVSANHISIAKPGDILFAKSSVIHIGRTTQIWDVHITNQKGKLVSSGRITMLITDIKS